MTNLYPFTVYVFFDHSGDLLLASTDFELVKAKAEDHKLEMVKYHISPVHLMEQWRRQREIEDAKTRNEGIESGSDRVEYSTLGRCGEGVGYDGNSEGRGRGTSHDHQVHPFPESHS